MNLKSDAKLRRVLAISKYLGLIFAELLRRDRLDATKGGQRPKSCRMNKENGGSKTITSIQGTGSNNSRQPPWTYHICSYYLYT